jgi:hypothetical protein
VKIKYRLKKNQPIWKKIAKFGSMKKTHLYGIKYNVPFHVIYYFTNGYLVAMVTEVVLSLKLLKVMWCFNTHKLL